MSFAQKVRLPVRFAPAIIAAAALSLAGCASKGELDASGGVTAIRSACPVVGVPAYTGDVTLFTLPGDRNAGAIDLSAVMTQVRGNCADVGDQIATTVTFEVRASRMQNSTARDVTLPYFITIVRGGSAVVAKRVGQVSLHFDAGQSRTVARGSASTSISRSAVTLPDDVRKKLTEKRKAGDEDAAIDPLTLPQVRQAVLSASFEALVGFQLTDDQLKYNVTR